MAVVVNPLNNSFIVIMFILLIASFLFKIQCTLLR